VVSIDAALLSTLADAVVQTQARIDLLQQCSVLDQSPWDGCEDMLTIQLAPMGEDEGRAQAKAGKEEAVAPGELRLAGLGELLLGCQVVLMTEEQWGQLQALHARAKHVLVRGDASLDAQDVHMLALFLALQRSHAGHSSADAAEGLEEDAAALVARLTHGGVKLATREEPRRGVGHAGADDDDDDDCKAHLRQAANATPREDGAENETGSDDDEEDDGLDWMALVGERAEEAPWLRSPAVVAAARLVVERRAARLALPLPTLVSGEGAGTEAAEGGGGGGGGGEGGGGGGEGTGRGGDPHPDAPTHVVAGTDDMASVRRLLSMAQRLRQLESAVLHAAQGALSALPLVACGAPRAH